MDSSPFLDGNIHRILDSRYLHSRPDVNQSLQTHSSLIRRLSQEKELEGHLGCVNAIAWNSKGSLLVSGSDDTRINVWSYAGQKLVHSIDTGHTANIFCTKFIPETSDELVASGAGDAEVRLFNRSRVSGNGLNDNPITPSALYQCHTRRVKKLAVENGNPNVVWSASEDGTLRQHDFREGTSCPPAGSPRQECHNVLLDLRNGAKRSLGDPPKQVLALKSFDISSTRPHLLLVGGSDAFARLYDRRMLPPLSSCGKRMPPPPCVNYFCPMHLSDRGHPSLHLTHVTFSPDGSEVLLSYSGEHVYLMNVNHAGVNEVQYSSGDVSKLMTYSPSVNGLELQPFVSNVFTNGFHTKKNITAKLDKCRKLIKYGKKSLDEGAPYYGIEACNEVLIGYNHIIGPALKQECLCTRAALLLKRKWKNDAHMAIRDCHAARKFDKSAYKPLYYMSEALSQLGKHKEALDFAVASHSLAPSKSEVAERVENAKKDIVLAETEKNSKTNNGRGGRMLSLSDILYRSEANSDTSQDGQRSDRDDSDYEEEMELDFETSVSGDEEHDSDSNILHRSLNLRIHRRGDSRENVEASGSDESPSSSSSSQNGRASYQPEAAIDMKQRFIGHCNVGTDIKQANFLGQKGEYVASGSDDGRWFIWEKRTGRLMKLLSGDESVVNCVQCHPFDFVVATSGIDNTIKIWTPSAPVASSVAGGSAGPETGDVLGAMENNQQKLSRNRDSMLPFELLEPFRMHEFPEGSLRLRPFECAQT
ncbi:putative transcription factor WD40-like family [Medicago truncatula]|uniref:Putative transcription factor WD40-like family n=1 Tax=Medicago truncatula TaxID=3880 RepID=G7J574_MEDTR|nr:protein ALTERED SEED GERMINATION 2 [Medicago truncatula]AES73199.2 transducin/WD-like repeat-protein [Medicago truncatula]RHN70221.1 putative transcription factor WD40-like family [Medicago truncatula]